MWRILDKLSNYNLLDIHPVRCNQPLFFLEVDQNNRIWSLDFERHHFETASCKLQNMFILTLTLICNYRYSHYVLRLWRWNLNDFRCQYHLVKNSQPHNPATLFTTDTVSADYSNIPVHSTNPTLGHLSLNQSLLTEKRQQCVVCFLIPGTLAASEANSTTASQDILPLTRKRVDKNRRIESIMNKTEVHQTNTDRGVAEEGMVLPSRAASAKDD
jgi:hypothetical protein